MEIYIVEQITEADFGCEETSRKEPMALLKLVGDTTKYVEVSEAELEKNGIKEGKKVIIANGKVLKYVRVVAAVIRSKNENGEPIIFATQRGYGEYKDGWEFPGGKIEEGETPEDALVREIKEELDTEIVVEDLIDTIEYDYPTFHLSMDCFFCKLLSGNLVLKEHEAAKWLTKEQLDSVDWLPADITLINKLF
jgi:8-oxo-dGTP diphosphatase